MTPRGRLRAQPTPRPNPCPENKIPSPSTGSPGGRDGVPLHRWVETLFADLAIWRAMAGDDITDGHAEAGERRIFIDVDFGFVRGLPRRGMQDEDSSKKIKFCSLF